MTTPRTRWHEHRCATSGCAGVVACKAPPEFTDPGWDCAETGLLCEDCLGLDTCSGCGELIREPSEQVTIYPLERKRETYCSLACAVEAEAI